jgi:hypothetical protein
MASIECAGSRQSYYYERIGFVLFNASRCGTTWTVRELSNVLVPSFCIANVTRRHRGHHSSKHGLFRPCVSAYLSILDFQQRRNLGSGTPQFFYLLCKRGVITNLLQDGSLFDFQRFPSCRRADQVWLSPRAPFVASSNPPKCKLVHDKKLGAKVPPPDGRLTAQLVQSGNLPRDRYAKDFIGDGTKSVSFGRPAHTLITLPAHLPPTPAVEEYLLSGRLPLVLHSLHSSDGPNTSY